MQSRGKNNLRIPQSQNQSYQYEKFPDISKFGTPESPIRPVSKPRNIFSNDSSIEAASIKDQSDIDHFKSNHLSKIGQINKFMCEF